MAGATGWEGGVSVGSTGADVSKDISLHGRGGWGQDYLTQPRLFSLLSVWKGAGNKQVLELDVNSCPSLFPSLIGWSLVKSTEHIHQTFCRCSPYVALWANTGIVLGKLSWGHFAKCKIHMAFVQAIRLTENFPRNIP